MPPSSTADSNTTNSSGCESSGSSIADYFRTHKPLTSSLAAEVEKKQGSQRRMLGPSRRPSVQAVLYYPQRYGSQLDGTSLLAHKTYKEEGRRSSATWLRNPPVGVVQGISNMSGYFCPAPRVATNRLPPPRPQRKVPDGCRFYGPQTLGRRRLSAAPTTTSPTG